MMVAPLHRRGDQSDLRAVPRVWSRRPPVVDHASNDLASLDQADQYDDHSDNQENVDESAHREAGHEPQRPQGDKYDGNSH